MTGSQNLKLLISKMAGGGEPAPEMSVPMRQVSGLRYGENPHQPAAFYTDLSLAEAGRGGIAGAVQHHGKEARTPIPQHHALTPTGAPESCDNVASLATVPRCLCGARQAPATEAGNTEQETSQCTL